MMQLARANCVVGVLAEPFRKGHVTWSEVIPEAVTVAGRRELPRHHALLAGDTDRRWGVGITKHNSGFSQTIESRRADYLVSCIAA